MSSQQRTCQFEMEMVNFDASEDLSTEYTSKINYNTIENCNLGLSLPPPPSSSLSSLKRITPPSPSFATKEEIPVFSGTSQLDTATRMDPEINFRSSNNGEMTIIDGVDFPPSNYSEKKKKKPKKKSSFCCDRRWFYNYKKKHDESFTESISKQLGISWIGRTIYPDKPSKGIKLILTLLLILLFMIVSTFVIYQITHEYNYPHSLENVFDSIAYWLFGDDVGNSGFDIIPITGDVPKENLSKVKKKPDKNNDEYDISPKILLKIAKFDQKITQYDFLMDEITSLVAKELSEEVNEYISQLQINITNIGKSLIKKQQRQQQQGEEEEEQREQESKPPKTPLEINMDTSSATTHLILNLFDVLEQHLMDNLMMYIKMQVKQQQKFKQTRFAEKSYFNRDLENNFKNLFIEALQTLLTSEFVDYRCCCKTNQDTHCKKAKESTITVTNSSQYNDKESEKKKDIKNRQKGQDFPKKQKSPNTNLRNEHVNKNGRGRGGSNTQQRQQQQQQQQQQQKQLQVDSCWIEQNIKPREPNKNHNGDSNDNDNDHKWDGNKMKLTSQGQEFTGSSQDSAGLRLIERTISSHSTTNNLLHLVLSDNFYDKNTTCSLLLLFDKGSTFG